MIKNWDTFYFFFSSRVLFVFLSLHFYNHSFSLSFYAHYFSNWYFRKIKWFSPNIKPNQYPSRLQPNKSTILINNKNKTIQRGKKREEKLQKLNIFFMDINTISSILMDYFSNLRNEDVLTSMNYLNQRGFRLLRMLGCGSFGAVLLAE